MRPLTQEETTGIPIQQIARFVTARKLFVAMIILQLLWIGGIWLTNATTAVYKLLPLTLYTILAGVFLILSPTPVLSKPLQNILASEKRGLLFLGALVLISGSIYAFNQRVWPFDEESNVAASTIVAEEGVRALFEQYEENDWLSRQHPPLVPILYGSVMRLFGTQRIVPCLLTLVFTLATGLLTYLMGRDLYDQRTGLIAAAILFSFPLVLRLGTAALLEMVLALLYAGGSLYVFIDWARAAHLFIE